MSLKIPYAPQMDRASKGGRSRRLPHPTRYLGTDDEENCLGMRRRVDVRQLRAIASNRCEANMEAGAANVKEKQGLAVKMRQAKC